MFLLFTSWNKFVGISVEAPLDESYSQGIHMKQITAEIIYSNTNYHQWVFIIMLNYLQVIQ
jgi:hypothetical protein